MSISYILFMLIDASPAECAIFWFLKFCEATRTPIPETLDAIDRAIGLKHGTASRIKKMRPTWLDAARFRLKSQGENKPLE